MSKLNLLSTLFVAAFIFSSCQKEVELEEMPAENVDVGILGNWKFVSAHTTTVVTDEISGSDLGTVKSVTTADYTTINNKGSVTIEDDRMLSKQISYDVSSTAKATFYQDDVLLESTEVPFEVSVPPSSSVAAYKRIGTDSLYFQNGSFGQVEGMPEGTQTQPSGLRYRLENDLLILTGHVEQNKQDYSSGIMQKTRSTATIVTTLQKQ